MHQIRRRRRAAAVALLLVVAVVVAVVLGAGGGGGPKRLVPGGDARSGQYDPLAWDSGREGDLVQRAAAGFSDPVWEKSPGGVVATARRVARWRPLIERAAKANGIDPATLEAIVFLESAGQPDVIAGGDIQGAVGLTQIVASTATSLLRMHVDLARSQTLTARIAAATTKAKARKLARARSAADQRFDPALSLAGAARYLAQAKRIFGREDLAVASYHMGVGNLQHVLRLYKSEGGDGSPSYAQLYFDTTPLGKPTAYALLSGFSDESSTYLWRVLAAEQVMRLSRSDPRRLAHLAALEHDAGPGARRLYPDGAPAAADGSGGAPPRYGPVVGLRFSGRARTSFNPSAGALAVLAYTGIGTRLISGQAPLTITSAHGIRIEVARHYTSRRQALAFQYMLDRLQAWNLIAWGRGGRTLAIVAGPDAGKLLPPADQMVRDARRR